MSLTDSLMANNITGAIICTLILDNTLKALARISWFGSLTKLLASTKINCPYFKSTLERANR